MKRKPTSRRRPARQVPPFYPVPVRRRHDGWTLERQARFLGMLAETGSVLAACGAVGMSRNTAYALRRKPDAESFAAAWDAALGRPIRKVTVRGTLFLAYSGLVRVQMYHGRYRGFWQKPDNSALTRLLGRLERAAFRDWLG